MSIEVDIEHIRGQLARLLSDWESEKETRRRRNKDIDDRLKALEIDKIKRDTTIVIVGILCTIIGSLATIIITHYLK